MIYKINNANIKEWAANYQGEPFDAILCDPPYELGFMGKSWDSSGIAFDKDMWADLLRHVKPGGHLLAFSGSRTYHRMACAIEDAGFEIRDMIEWIYGSGFPKSLNIGKAVDKIQGNGREVTGETRIGKTSLGENSNWDTSDNMKSIKDSGKVDITKGSSPYEGYGTALKPAHEPCVLARKPLEKGMTVASNALKHSTGGLNIDGSRVTAGKEITDRISLGGNKNKSNAMNELKEVTYERNNLGRFPANLIHDGSDEVVGLFPDTKSGAVKTGTKQGFAGTGIYGNSAGNFTERHASSGSAARFFYTAKASKSERNAGLGGFEDRRAGAMEFRNRESEKGQFEGDPQYAKNYHPTVKPLTLTRYLANLIKPPTGGRLLVPFSGSGSEMIGALQAGWEYVEGVELTDEYIPIAEARIKYWLKEVDSEQMELL